MSYLLRDNTVKKLATNAWHFTVISLKKRTIIEKHIPFLIASSILRMRINILEIR